MIKIPKSPQSGFSLIEIMIGLVIGLIATLVIVNVFSIFEEQKRITTGNSDAQTNGAIGLYNLQRDIQIAGFGLPVFGKEYTPYNCPTGSGAPTINHDNNSTTAAIGLSPLIIVDSDPSSINSSDTVAIRAGDSMRGGIGVDMKAGTGTPPTDATVDTHLGCALNDVALIINPTGNNCNMTRVAGLSASGLTPKVSFPAGTPNIAPGSVLSCLGNWNEFRYTINANSELTRTGALVAGVPNATPIPIVGDIVNMQAQYGVSSSPSENRINAWVNATGSWANPSVNDRNRIKAIRIAIVARNGLLQTTNVTTECSSLTDPNPTGLCAWGGSATSQAPAIDLSADVNWQRYRYRVYESIIPLRNIIWSGSKL